MSINIRQSPLTGRHLLAADKPLTKFAISLGAGALPARRAPTRKTAVGRPRHPPRHPSRQSPGFSALLRRLPAQGRTHARARTLTHVHTQQKEAVRAACGGPLGALGKAPPPGRRCTARAACSLTGAPSERPGCAERRAERPPDCARPRSRGAATAAALGPPPRSPAPLLRPPPSGAPAKARPCGRLSRPPARDCPGFSRNVTLILNYPHPYKPRHV